MRIARDGSIGVARGGQRGQWCSLGSPDTSTSFFARPLKKG